MLFAIFIIYIGLVDNTDSCSRRIFLQYAYGYFSFWIYITLACIFGKERQLFIDVGCETNPGVKATYDVNGNVIVRAVITPNQQVQVFNPNNQFNPMNQPSLDLIKQSKIQPVTQNALIQQEQIPQKKKHKSGRKSSKRIKN